MRRTPGLPASMRTNPESTGATWTSDNCSVTPNFSRSKRRSAIDWSLRNGRTGADEWKDWSDEHGDNDEWPQGIGGPHDWKSNGEGWGRPHHPDHADRAQTGGQGARQGAPDRQSARREAISLYRRHLDRFPASRRRIHDFQFGPARQPYRLRNAGGRTEGAVAAPAADGPAVRGR